MPGNGNTNNATVKRALLKGKKAPEALTALDTVCSAGAQCAEVQASPIAKQSLADLQTALTAGHGSLTSKLISAQALMAAAKALNFDIGVLKVKLRGYETAVNGIAAGDASVITKAGLPSRAQKNPVAVLGQITVVTAKPGKIPTEAVLSWPAVAGATGYAIEVNWTPGTPTAPWISLQQGSRRRRAVKAPTPASQFLARVAAVASDGTQSDWSAAVLATTL